MTRSSFWGFVLLSQLGFGFQPASLADADREAGVYRVGDGVSPPKIIRRYDPRYTSQARRAAIQGTVVLEVTVDERGNPSAISIVSPLGFGLDERARETVSRWAFQPGVKDGVPVKTRTSLEVNFRLFHRWFDPKMEERRTAFNLV